MDADLLINLQLPDLIGGARILCRRYAAVLLACIPLTVTAGPELVIEYESGNILHQSDANQSWYPASLTKMMTLYLTFKALDAGTLALNDQLRVSAHAAAQPPTRLYLRQGETLSVEDAIRAVATVSANDAAVVLAERLAGSEQRFAQSMTQRARFLGMRSTRFRNASGLPDNEQRSSAKDMAILARSLIETFPQYFHYFSRRAITFKGKSRASTNGFTAAYRGADGLKTGFTCGSGYNLVATAKRNNRRLIGVVLGARSSGSRSAKMRRLLDRAFSDSGSAGDYPSIDDLTTVQGQILSPPPVVLKGSNCGSRRPAQKYVMQEGSLPGWGILLGVQSLKKQAISVLDKARSELKRVDIAASPALLKREFAKGSSWKILLVGMEKTDAGKACVHLLSKAVNCVIQSPNRMNKTGYSLR